MELVREVMTHPRVYPWIGDDGSPAREEFRPNDHPALWYVLAFDGEDLLGLWLFVPLNAITWEAHTCLLPGHGFRRGRQAGKEVIEWLWANTPCERLVTSVPTYNRAALQFAKAAGMQEYGRNPQSFLKDGRRHDQILLGIGRNGAS